MEWEKEKCLQLIDEYEHQELLWNPRHGSYYNKLKKNQAWILISRAVGCSTEEIKKKMESLLSSYRREKAKGTKTIGTGKGAQEVNVSKWFAFNRMAFLKNRDKPRSTRSTLADPHISVDLECESIVHDFPVAPSHIVIPSSSQPLGQRPREATKRIKKEAPEEDLLEISCSTLKKSSNTDKHDIFGQHVASAIRDMSLEQQIYAEKIISEVLFEGRLGNLSRNYLFQVNPNLAFPQAATPFYSDSGPRRPSSSLPTTSAYSTGTPEEVES